MLPSDLKSAVFTMAMANGDESTFEQLVKVCVGVCYVCVLLCVHRKGKNNRDLLSVLSIPLIHPLYACPF